ncbi:dolichyl-phosphate-mannose--protein mannosyltransferase [Microbacterium sp. ASV49]|uniref:Polyprenol-phosphate-mannose--protein mannosyltransferase n=1 Tax=Microbacterium candidum TaxID=3041922 RepID=A0ABT7N1T6_9MICO|nr:phospholipid carrier-dependent glycosyltransferase [Microbacterium sp. ASV49]MDL9980664.1 phospholipid carrier-dependent glycosyltransferase [Microbacterium sp. ASV49]
MTSIDEPLLAHAAVRPSLYDRWVGRIHADPSRARFYDWAAPILVTVLAGILRFWNLAQPHALVFDETYYVKDAWSQWILGYPSTWPNNADRDFAAGHTDIFTKTGSFVVHPPLGKYLIGLGMWIFGAESSFAWRVAVAFVGTMTVLVLYFVAREMTGSTRFATVAGLLMAIDGLAIVMSRVSILDIFLTFFILLAVWFILLDRRSHLERLAELIVARTADDERLRWGPVLWRRPWLLAAGIALGAATAVKWSGLYVLVGFAIYVIVTDALARRRAGVVMWGLDSLRQGLVAALWAVPAALVVYLVSWTGWLVTSGGYDRTSAEAPASGFWSWVPAPLRALWNYHQAMYGFHVGLTTPHTYASPAWQWPFLIRPTSMYWHQDQFGQNGCTFASSCVQAISSIPNPLIWWGSVAAAIYLVYRFIVARDWRYAVVLTALAATYVPWLLYPERTIFQFYTIAMLPFLILALTFALQALAGASSGDRHRRLVGQRVVWIYLIVVALVSALWYPAITGMTIPYDFWRLHNWIQTWI